MSASRTIKATRHGRRTRGVTVDEAFVLIRAYARRSNQRLGDVAQAVVADPTVLPGLFA
ncbi:hypothetical protein F4553_001061 [Allocatelliglobosispora scoriae]|uniref:ANTAR domain-containing protein n=1 Tax=Allocatelliglobosispora scoriae TaxID=643052 RepID=A0A841BLQ6_9ACTN|nr:ANTAR domain-containing protein [Allocatelliglobosispora scoriae]MBB5867682.1 hypothetical protein [Allocatelliglobosispora scoriae]